MMSDAISPHPGTETGRNSITVEDSIEDFNAFTVLRKVPSPASTRSGGMCSTSIEDSDETSNAFTPTVKNTFLHFNIYKHSDRRLRRSRSLEPALSPTDGCLTTIKDSENTSNPITPQPQETVRTAKKPYWRKKNSDKRRRTRRSGQCSWSEVDPA